MKRRIRNFFINRKKCMNMKFIMSVCVILLMFISYHTYVHADITTTGRKGIAMSTKCTYFDPDCDNYPIEPGFVYIQPFTAPKLEDVYKGKNFMLHKGVRDASFDEINEINKEDWPKKYNKANYNAFEQYRVLRLASALQTPNMTEDAIIFVPQAATDQSKSIYKGWLGEKSFIWYTKPKSIFNDKSHMDNMVFYCANKSNTNRSIGDICNKGIYRKELEKLLTQKDKDGKITINEELHSFNEENIKELINDKTKINQSKFLWTYLTNIELEEKGNKKKYVFQANERIANFLSGAQDGSITIDDMKNFTKEDYIDYTIRYLDLCLCAYACVYDPNTEATSAKAWKELCVNYINTFRLDDGYRKLNQCHIEVGTGMISVGQYPHDNGDDQICCYIGCQNLVDIIYKLKSAGYNDKDLEKNKISVSKGFPGLWYSVSEYGLSNKYKGYENNPNVKSIWSQEELLGKTNDEIDGLNNGWLDIITTYYKSTDDEKLQSATKNYFDYYERLQHAIKNNESKNSKKKLEYPYLHKNCHIWCSRTILTRVLRTVYESANKPTSYADNLCFIEIAHQGMFNSSMKWGPYKEVDGMYGGFYLPAYHFNPPPVTPPEVDFVAFLDIKSKDLGDEKYHKGEKKSSGKNKIGKHKNVKLNVTYKEYRTKTNDEVSLQLRLKTSDAKKWEQLLSMEGVEPKITVKFTPLESLKEEKLKSTFLPLNKNKSIINYKTVPDKKDAETAGVRSIRKWLINEEPKPVLAEMDKEFLKNGMSGIQDNKKTIGYKATVEIKYKVNGKNVTITRDTNEVRVSYVSFSPITPPPSTEFITTEPPTTEIPPTPLGGTYFSNPYSYAELKDGSVYNETFEAMAGVPSTRPLYFSTGGTEFIVNLCAEYDRDQEAKRTYHSHFKETDCEYKKNDQLKELAAEQPAMIETFVADNDDEEVKTQVTAEENKAIIPKYIDTSLPNNTTVKKHNMATTFCASWSGTIRNNANMTEDGYKAPGAPCKGAESIGSEGAVNGTKTKWDVSEYKTKIDEAIEWAKAMQNTNQTYTVMKIADSDGQKRMYKVGNAILTVNLAYQQAESIDKGRTNKTVQEQYEVATYTGEHIYEDIHNCSEALAESIITKLGDGYRTYAGSSGVIREPKTTHCTKTDDGDDPNNPGEKIPHKHKMVTCSDCGVSYCSDGGNHDPGEMCDDRAQCKKTPDIPFTIKVIFQNGSLSAQNYDGDSIEVTEQTGLTSLPAHALCGPCCEHVLPEIEDKWEQTIKFDTVRITNVRVWKLDKGYVNGMTEIQKGDQYTGEDYDTVIAGVTQGDPNIFYNIANANTSKAGRIRYDIQTGQDDNVYYEEMTSPTKDGTDYTIQHRTNKCDGMKKVISNKNPVQSGGQGHKQSWSQGCLYSNTAFTDDPDHHMKLDNEKKTDYSSDMVDEIDKKSEEWKRFNMRRKEKVKANIISDFLILQTSSGDQSILYEKRSTTAETQKNFKALTFDDMEYGWKVMWATNKLRRVSGEINVGSYNGEYNKPKEKYKGNGNGDEIVTDFDQDEENYNKIEDKYKMAFVKAKRIIKNSPHRNVSTPGLSYKRLERPKDLIITKPNIKQCVINENKEYETGQSYAFYKEILAYDSDDGESEEAKEFEYEIETTYDPVAKANGYTQESVYTDGKTKVNNIVVHDPISVAQAMIVKQNNTLDQRILDGLVTSKSKNEELGKEGECPGTPEECEFRKLDCQFEKEIVKAVYDVSNYDEYTNPEDSSGKKYYTISNNIKNASGYNSSISLDGTNFSPVSYSNNEVYLYCNGKGSLPIRWSSIAIDPTCVAEQIQVEGQFIIQKLPSSFDTTRPTLPLIGTDTVTIGSDKKGFLYAVLPNGRVLKSKKSVISAGSLFKLAVKLEFGSMNVTLYVNDTQIDTQMIKEGEESLNIIDLAGDCLYFGNNETTNESIQLYVNKMRVVRLPGVLRHTDACYTEYTIHETIENDYYNGLNPGSDKIDWTRSQDVGNEKVNSEDNTHKHTTNCLTKDSPGLQLAIRHGIMGDWTDLKKEVGENSSLWWKLNYFIELQNLNQYKLDTSHAKTFNYTGGSQSVTLPAGLYKVEAWGAQGGDKNDSNGGKGGYSSAVLELSKSQKLYLQVGGKGASGANATGGYNGGGNAGNSGGAGSGGGASSIAISDGTLNQVLNKRKSDVLLVAGGGGGAGNPKNELRLSTGLDYDFVRTVDGSGRYYMGDFVAKKSGKQTIEFTCSHGYVEYFQVYKGHQQLAQSPNAYKYTREETDPVEVTVDLVKGETYTVMVESYHTDFVGECRVQCTYEWELNAKHGGAGGGPAGGNGGAEDYISGYDGLGGSANSYSALGLGESNSGSGAGGGGGYYGGFAGSSKGGAGGGSGYISDRLANSKSISGNHLGDGCIKITPIDMSPYDNLIHMIISDRASIPDKVTTGSTTIINPIWNCGCVCNEHKCTSNCVKEKILNCSEPHHNGLHYDYSNTLCYQPCLNDDNHKLMIQDTKDTSGKAIELEDYIALDHRFLVYFPNKGNFYESTDLGLLDTRRIKGLGYTADMNTTKWTREKWVRFPFGVLYCRNGIWEQYESDEWISLEITADGNRDGAGIEYYEFYCQLKNDEISNGMVDYVVEAINKHESPGGEDSPYTQDYDADIEGPETNEFTTNAKRFDDLTAYQSVYKYHFIDVGGRIGNLIIEDTQDLRFCNLFKHPYDLDEWLIDGILKKVDPTVPNGYLSWHRNNGEFAVDLRGETVCAENQFYNTYGTQEWTNKVNCGSLPLSADKNTIPALQKDQLKLGYNVLWDISTIGNYDEGTLQVIPYYYAFNKTTGVLTPVDVYMNSGKHVVPINFFGVFDQGVESFDYKVNYPKIFNYVMNLDWLNEAKRRNYSLEESLITEYISKNKKINVVDSEGNYAYEVHNKDGNIISKSQEGNDPENYRYYLNVNTQVPTGHDYILGNAQLLQIGEKGRTYIGTSKVMAENINNSHETELGNCDQFFYNEKGQRWHLTLGLPSTSIFVAYRNGKRTNPYEQITTNEGDTIYAKDEFTSDDYVFLMTADIRVIGDVYDLKYSQGKDNGVFYLDGNQYSLGDEIPTLLAIYQGNSTVDYDIRQTH